MHGLRKASAMVQRSAGARRFMRIPLDARNAGIRMTRSYRNKCGAVSAVEIARRPPRCRGSVVRRHPRAVKAQMARALTP